VLRRIFGPKRDEVTGEWRNGEENAYRLFVGKPKGKRQLGRPRRMLVDN
jgi:hypothetical protein